MTTPDDFVEEAVLPRDVVWRAERYEALGLDPMYAITLAGKRDPSTGWYADWHRFAAMVADGCSPKVAFEILA